MRLRLVRLHREKEAREGRRITQEELARELGISQQHVSVLMRAENKQVSYELLGSLSRYFDVPMNQLFDGAPVQENPVASVEIDANSLVLLPVLGKINAGPLDTEHQDILEWYPWPTSLGARLGCFAVLVQGDSMVDAHVVPGSRVILDPKIEARSGDIVAVLLNGESTLKRIYIDDSGNAVLLSENREENYPPIFVRKDQDELQIQGVVVNIILTPEPRRFYPR